MLNQGASFALMSFECETSICEYISNVGVRLNRSRTLRRVNFREAGK